ncbi:hypothetical protein HDU92_005117 [Lobulomyces angularis]|nr:hypothetical protein HDU92_005117 [Lobulomyces angularis]
MMEFDDYHYDFEMEEKFKSKSPSILEESTAIKVHGLKGSEVSSINEFQTSNIDPPLLKKKVITHKTVVVSKNLKEKLIPEKKKEDKKKHKKNKSVYNGDEYAKTVHAGQFEEIVKAIKVADERKAICKKLIAEMKLLKLESQKKDKIINQLQKENKQVPEIIHSLSEEARVLRFEKQGYLEKIKITEKNSQLNIEELLSLREQVNKLNTIIKSKKLNNVEKLMEELKNLKDQNEKNLTEISNWQRKATHIEHEKGMELREVRQKLQKALKENSLFHSERDGLIEKIKSKDKQIAALSIYTLSTKKTQQKIIETLPIQQIYSPLPPQLLATEDSVTFEAEILTGLKQNEPDPSQKLKKNENETKQNLQEVTRSLEAKNNKIINDPHVEKSTTTTAQFTKNFAKPILNKIKNEDLSISQQSVDYNTNQDFKIEKSNENNTFKPNLFKPVMGKNKVELQKEKHHVTEVTAETTVEKKEFDTEEDSEFHFKNKDNFKKNDTTVENNNEEVEKFTIKSTADSISSFGSSNTCSSPTTNGLQETTFQQNLKLKIKELQTKLQNLEGIKINSFTDLEEKAKLKLEIKNLEKKLLISGEGNEQVDENTLQSTNNAPTIENRLDFLETSTNQKSKKADKEEEKFNSSQIPTFGRRKKREELKKDIFASSDSLTNSQKQNETALQKSKISNSSLSFLNSKPKSPPTNNLNTSSGYKPTFLNFNNNTFNNKKIASTESLIFSNDNLNKKKEDEICKPSFFNTNQKSLEKTKKENVEEDFSYNKESSKQSLVKEEIEEELSKKEEFKYGNSLDTVHDPYQDDFEAQDDLDAEWV